MDNNNGLNEEILDKITTVCMCRAVKRKTIKDALKDGCDSFEKIKSATGAGSGSCCGKRCRAKIDALIKNS